MTEFGDALKLPLYFPGLNLGAGTSLFGNVPDSISSPGLSPLGARLGVPRRPG
jgi:hypothetical protein